MAIGHTQRAGPLFSNFFCGSGLSIDTVYMDCSLAHLIACKSVCHLNNILDCFHAKIQEFAEKGHAAELLVNAPPARQYEAVLNSDILHTDSVDTMTHDAFGHLIPASPAHVNA